MQASVAVVGSINLDLVARGERLPRAGETLQAATFDRVPGGKGANQAVAAARLGADVRLVGCVGDDWLADEALAGAHEAGIDLQVDRASGESTGVAFIVVSDDGDNQIVTAAGANGRLRPENVDVAYAAAVVCQLEIPLEVVAEAADQAMFFCLNAAPARRLPAELLDQADLVVANRLEIEELGPRPRGLTAITLGSEGALLLEDGEEIARARPPEIRAVDGTAAGDAFTACLVVSLLEGRGRTEALRRACAAGALAASRPGAQPSLPFAVDVDEILRT